MLSKKLQFFYEKDVRIQREEAEKIGFDKGFEEGIKETKLKAAKNLLELGFAVEVIAKATGLSVQKLKLFNSNGKEITIKDVYAERRGCCIKT